MAKEKRKHGERGKTGETKGEIIKYALEHGGMFEESVLKDDLEKKINVKRDTIKKHLQDLDKKGIFKKTGQKGYTNNRQIEEDTKAIAIIYKEYPHLLRYLQQSDFILDCVAKKQSLLFEDNDALVELKKMLRWSPKMFELCLTIDNLGRQFLMVSSKIDYYGISERAFEKTFPDSGEISDYAPSIKHYIRWQLFRSCLKTDSSYVKDEIPEEILEMVSYENTKRECVDICFNSNNGQNNESTKMLEAEVIAINEELFEDILKALENEEKEEG